MNVLKAFDLYVFLTGGDALWLASGALIVGVGFWAYTWKMLRGFFAIENRQSRKIHELQEALNREERRVVSVNEQLRAAETVVKAVNEKREELDKQLMDRSRQDGYWQHDSQLTKKQLQESETRCKELQSEIEQLKGALTEARGQEKSNGEWNDKRVQLALQERNAWKKEAEDLKQEIDTHRQISEVQSEESKQIRACLEEMHRLLTGTSPKGFLKEAPNTASLAKQVRQQLETMCRMRQDAEVGKIPENEWSPKSAIEEVNPQQDREKLQALLAGVRQSLRVLRKSGLLSAGRDTPSGEDSISAISGDLWNGIKTAISQLDAQRATCVSLEQHNQNLSEKVEAQKAELDKLRKDQKTDDAGFTPFL